MIVKSIKYCIFQSAESLLFAEQLESSAAVYGNLTQKTSLLLSTFLYVLCGTHTTLRTLSRQQHEPAATLLSCLQLIIPSLLVTWDATRRLVI